VTYLLPDSQMASVMRYRPILLLGTILILLGASASSASAANPSIKKAIWGPASAFSTYQDMGAGIYETNLSWADIAPRRPAHPTDPNDPAYHWPQDVDLAVSQAARHHMRVSIQLNFAPRWANGGRSANYAPQRVSDFDNFALAAARRYRSVHLWMIWGEPSRQANFAPLTPERRDHPLNRAQARAPHRYAQILDAAYGTLKHANRGNLIIGGNTFVTGDISPYNWIRNLRLPNGRAPRMDMYGHNPFGARKPDLRKPPTGHGFADFSDLGRLAGWLDRYLRPHMHGHPRLKLFLSEYTLPTDHLDYEFNFYVDRSTQADWLAAGLRIAHRWSRIYTLGWIPLEDQQPNATHDEVTGGLIDAQGHRKPSYYAYRRG